MSIPSFRKHIGAFAEPNVALPYNTSVIDRNSTTTEEPIYAKRFPYQMSAASFVNEEFTSSWNNSKIRIALQFTNICC